MSNNNNQKNPLDAASTTARELNEVNTMADSKPRPDEEMAESKITTDFTYPVYFRQTEGYDDGDGRLRFKYEWDPANGYTEHLSGCRVGEKVVYPGGNPYSPPIPPFSKWEWPNPTIAYVNGAERAFSDTHYADGFTMPFISLGITATQNYSWRHSWWTQDMDDVPLMGPLIIYRTVYPENGKWWYKVEKSGVSAQLALSTIKAEKMENIRDINEILSLVSTLQIGSTRADLLKDFRPCGGLSSIHEERYQMKECPSVKVNVKFQFVDSTHPFDGQDIIVGISKYYLDASRIGD